MILDKAGYRVITAENGFSGVEKVWSEMPDLVLLDIVMPDMDRITVCRILKNDPLTLDIPILMIPSMTSAKDKVDCFDLRAADYLPKPFQPQEVLVRVRTHLKLRKLYRTMVEHKKLLEDKQQALDQDLLDAAKVQQHLLPQSLPLTAMEFFWYFQPCERVSGDIFNVFHLDADHMALYMVDVSGHGVSAALITALVSEFFLHMKGGCKRMRASLPPVVFAGQWRWWHFWTKSSLWSVLIVISLYFICLSMFISENICSWNFIGKSNSCLSRNESNVSRCHGFAAFSRFCNALDDN